MLTIRLTRKGKKNQPFFRVVLIDKRRSTKGGRSVEDLGYVDPLKKRKSFNKERILYWISKGAQTSATIHNLLVSEKIIDAKKIHVSRLSKKAEAKIIETKKVEEASASAKASADKEAEKPVEEVKAEEPAPAE
ncbi:MAG: 30S ribosomal protein S16 [Candidatus Staskawiczbacteria bacterium]|nr:30S ribosomal protein S16 [Candidatus Staskawiczbacteria bacterium]